MGIRGGRDELVELLGRAGLEVVGEGRVEEDRGVRLFLAESCGDGPAAARRTDRLLRQGAGSAETAARNPALPVEVMRRMVEWLSVRT
ncbi:hypothetical protein [Streptomyces sp. SID13726]|uniref:hypothetical protein n=1 Tax=Streptomyces sp. SID13726 TaxID=2706058 RepID=UPI0013B80A22|nr:hypothetical protein [Streptomyces sp. SID13726]NEA97955.1 hypothetical protein [Streptomyces sp. SID13726]